MKFVWAKGEKRINEQLIFTYRINKKCDAIELCAADFFRVFIDGKLKSYGPERTTEGYARKRRVSIPSGAKILQVRVLYYGVSAYSCALQKPYFGARILCGETVVDQTEAFECTRENAKKTSVPKYSNQRGFLEVYDCRDSSFIAAETESIDAPCVIDGLGDSCAYEEYDLSYKGKSVFKTFDYVDKLWWQAASEKKTGIPEYKVEKDFLSVIPGLKCCDYTAEYEVCGFIKLEVRAKEEVKIFAVFEEFLPDGRWIFRRSSCNDFIEWTVPAGKSSLLSAEPYAFKHLKIITDGDAEIRPSVIKIENNREFAVKVKGEGTIKSIFDAAEKTFRHNTVDIFTDCPGRERAGWLCDSYFMGIAERMFTGKNEIEKRFIENYLLIDTSSDEKVVLPMCYPSSTDGLFIPNWVMWFVLEIAEYFKRSGDGELVKAAREKIYKIVSYFKDFENEYGLLENLEGWVFIEWSICNDEEYTKGVNFPSNMLYAKMLETVYCLYGDDALYAHAQDIKRTIKGLSFDGEYFAENAIRVGDKLVRQDKHLSETCQYYALFTGTCSDADFRDRIINGFGPLNPVKDGIGKSNVFIGYYLRLMNLCAHGEYNRVIEESEKLFGKMAETTGTFWENDSPTASCDHGFASVIAVYLLESVFGYKGVKDGSVIIDNIKNGKSRNVTAEFNYGNGVTVVEA